MEEPSSQADELARQVIGAAIEVHNHLGAGFAEGTYENALAIEMELRDIPFQRQAPITLQYKGREIGEGRLDFLIDHSLVVELKAVDAIGPIHYAQTLSYLRATGLDLGLLLNFNVKRLRDGVKRIVKSSAKQ